MKERSVITPYRVGNKNSKIYNGMTPKFGVTLNGIDCIVKLSKSKTEKDISALCEYTASHFINEIGFKAHKTVLQTYNGETVVLLKDFTSENNTLKSFRNICESSENTVIATKGYTYEDVADTIINHTKFSDKFKKQALTQFWEMYFCDAILGNRDRHIGNWGYLTNNGDYIMAPIYDNGASLFPQVNKHIENYLTDRKEFLFDRAERYPASILGEYSPKDRRVKKTNYYEYIGRKGKKPTEFTCVLEKIRKLGVDNIRNAAIKSVDSPYIDNIYKRFFVDIICIRYMHIILRYSLEESYERLMSYGM